MTQQPINRCLSNKSMDHIDHALGRPLDPMAETYRNFFAISGGPIADEMAASPFWREGCRSETMHFFVVTDEGRRALASHLREIGDKHRAYEIVFDGRASTVVATSRSKARYSYFSDLIDVCPDITFKDFCKRVSVRAA